MRLIDLDFAKEKIKQSDLTNQEKMVCLLMMEVALEDARNVPLTLDELREMEGEPVYCISDYEMTVNGEKDYRSHAEGWGIVTGTDLGDQGFVSETTRTYYLEHYGKTWLAYRRRPEEVNNEQ